MTIYEITVTADTDRPLLEVPLTVTVEHGENPVMSLENVRGYSEQELAVEYVARFFGNVTKTVTSTGDVMYA